MTFNVITTQLDDFYNQWGATIHANNYNVSGSASIDLADFKNNGVFPAVGDLKSSQQQVTLQNHYATIDAREL